MNTITLEETEEAINTEETTDAHLSWPPAYTLRRSVRARQTFLQIKKTSGLEIVIPYRQKKIDIEQLLNSKRRWIEKTLSKMTSIPVLQNTIETLPNSISCLALNKCWDIVYQFHPTKTVKLIVAPSDNRLILKGNIQQATLCHKTLKKWLVKMARHYLIPWLYALSKETGLLFNRALIRGQTTLWGSCNTRKTISLNYKLLFLPRSLAQHVLLHELCHLKHLNHSDNFWTLLNTLDTNSHQHKKDLKLADDYIPGWV